MEIAQIICIDGFSMDRLVSLQCSSHKIPVYIGEEMFGLLLSKCPNVQFLRLDGVSPDVVVKDACPALRGLTLHDEFGTMDASRFLRVFGNRLEFLSLRGCYMELKCPLMKRLTQLRIGDCWQCSSMQRVEKLLPQVANLRKIGFVHGETHHDIGVIKSEFEMIKRCKRLTYIEYIVRLSETESSDNQFKVFRAFDFIKYLFQRFNELIEAGVLDRKSLKIKVSAEFSIQVSEGYIRSAMGAVRSVVASLISSKWGDGDFMLILETDQQMADEIVRVEIPDSVQMTRQGHTVIIKNTDCTLDAYTEEWLMRGTDN